MGDGIFNPFEEPKPAKAAPTIDPTGETQYVPPEVTLDMGIYVLKLKNAKVEDVANRMGALIKELMDKYPEGFLHTGVNIIPRGDTYQLDHEEVQLTTDSGYLCVYVGDMSDNPDELENEAFKRIAHAISVTKDPEILDKHGVTLIRR